MSTKSFRTKQFSPRQSTYDCVDKTKTNEDFSPHCYMWTKYLVDIKASTKCSTMSTKID